MHYRLVVAALLREFEDGEATFGQLAWTLSRRGTLGQGQDLRRRLWLALRGLDAAGVVHVTDPWEGDDAEPSVLLINDGEDAH